MEVLLRKNKDTIAPSISNKAEPHLRYYVRCNVAHSAAVSSSSFAVIVVELCVCSSVIKDVETLNAGCVSESSDRILTRRGSERTSERASAPAIGETSLDSRREGVSFMLAVVQ